MDLWVSRIDGDTGLDLSENIYFVEEYAAMLWGIMKEYDEMSDKYYLYRIFEEPSDYHKCVIKLINVKWSNEDEKNKWSLEHIRSRDMFFDDDSKSYKLVVTKVKPFLTLYKNIMYLFYVKIQFSSKFNVPYCDENAYIIFSGHMREYCGYIPYYNNDLEHNSVHNAFTAAGYFNLPNDRKYNEISYYYNNGFLNEVGIYSKTLNEAYNSIKIIQDALVKKGCTITGEIDINIRDSYKCLSNIIIPELFNIILDYLVPIVD